MKKDIQKTFFKAFQLGGVVDHCIDVIRERYDLGYHPKNGKVLEEEWLHYYDVTLPDIIKKEIALYDDSVIEYVDSPLIDEIEENMEVCKSDAERERYLFSLLKPFKEFSDVFCPIAKIERLKLNIEKCKVDIKMWEQSPDKNEAKRQIDACSRTIEDHTKDIERIYRINSRFCEIVGCQINEEDSVEWCLGVFCSAAHKFANRLDALLLIYGIDFMRLQRESGIYLKSHRSITDVDFYIGSIELAQKYINELEKITPALNDLSIIAKETNKSDFSADQDERISLIIKEETDKSDIQPSKPNPIKLNFASYLEHNNKPKLIEFLRNKFPKGEGKEAAVMTMALQKLGFINIPTNLSELVRVIAKEWNIEITGVDGFLVRYRELDRGNHKNDLATAINEIRSFDDC